MKTEPLHWALEESNEMLHELDCRNAMLCVFAELLEGDSSDKEKLEKIFERLDEEGFIENSKIDG